MLTPLLAQRIEGYAIEHQPEATDPAAYAAAMMARLWAGDPTLLALLILDPEAGMPTGHLLADRNNVVQLRADQNVGNAKQECVEYAKQWAASLGAPALFLNVHRDPKTWAPLGFQSVRHVLRAPLTQAQAAPLRLVEGS